MQFSSRGIQDISVQIDAELLAYVDQLSTQFPGDRHAQRNRAIAEALDLWCRQQIQAQPRSQPQPQRPVDYHRRRHEDDETGWLV